MEQQMQRILQQAGQIILKAEREKGVKEKTGEANFVTKYDVAVQQFLRTELLALCPDARFVGEEEEQHADITKGRAFIVDPIDGTTNFIKGCNASAVSAALLEDGKVIVGAVYDPYRGEFFYAEKGKGTTCCGCPVHVSDEPLADSIVCLGTSPYYKELRESTFRLANAFMEHALDLRRSGSAVIDFCQVVRGAAGFFCEKRLSPWDYAASSLLITEAGGVISRTDGTPLVFDRPCGVIAGTKAAWDDYFRLGLDRI